MVDTFLGLRVFPGKLYKLNKLYKALSASASLISLRPLSAREPTEKRSRAQKIAKR